MWRKLSARTEAKVYQGLEERIFGRMFGACFLNKGRVGFLNKGKFS